MIIRVKEWNGIEAGTPIRVAGTPRTARWTFLAFCMSGNKAWIECIGGKPGRVQNLRAFPAEACTVDRRKVLTQEDATARRQRRRKDSDG